MKSKKILAAIMAAGMVAAGLAGCSGQAATQGAAATEAKQTAADLEGTITLYTSQPETDAQVLIDGFNEKYPDVKVEVFRSGTEEVISKVLAEQQVGAVQADVLLVADSVTFESLKGQDLMMQYESPELTGIPADFIDRDHTYTGTKVITTGVVYNTDLVTVAPAGFADLAGEALKDNTIMPSPLYSGAAAYNLGVMTRTHGLGWEFYEGLKANGVTVDKGNGAVQTAVVAGEKAAGVLVDYMAVRSRSEGAPVDFVYPEEGSPAVTEPIGILKDTKNADQAKAFVDFVLSADGQTLAASIGYTPIKEGVKAPEGLKSINDIKTMTIDIQELYQQRDADKLKFTEMFQ